MKKLGLSLALFIGAIVVLYFWAGTAWNPGSEYERIITYDKQANPKDTLKVTSYNIGYLSGMKNNLPMDMPRELFDKNLDRLIQFLKSESPDIIGFQEIDFGGNRSYYQNQLDSVALALGYHTAYRSINWDKTYVPFPYWPPKFHFRKMLSGQAILSRYPIVKSETTTLEKPINAPFYYNHFYLDRLIQSADILIGEDTLKVVNLHLEAFDTETRESQAYAVKFHIESESKKGPLLVIGDFNAEPPWSPTADETMHTILGSEGVKSAVDQSNENKTFSTGEPERMIDYIIFNPSYIQKIESGVGLQAGDISDHYPVTMSFTFKDEIDSGIDD